MASERLTPGLTAEIETVVDDQLVVKHMGGEGVLSTPSMVGLMERAGIQAVQAHLPEGHTGLRDPLVARALALLHNAPAQNWTLDKLAAQAATSRSVLAERFVHFIGQPPMQYLRELRMQLASRLLVEDGAKVASVAAAVGFESEAAFSRAFKKCVGLPPDEWRRHQAS